MTTATLLEKLWSDTFPGEEWPGESSALLYVFTTLTGLRGTVESIHAGQPKPMRTHEEIQHAHDLLGGLLTHPHLDTVFDAAVMRTVNDRVQTLCWVLLHTHSTMFQDHLDALERGLAAAGIMLRRCPKEPPQQ